MQSAFVAKQLAGHPRGGRTAHHHLHIIVLRRPLVPEQFECLEKARLPSVQPWQLVDKNQHPRLRQLRLEMILQCEKSLHPILRHGRRRSAVTLQLVGKVGQLLAARPLVDAGHVKVVPSLKVLVDEERFAYAATSIHRHKLRPRAIVSLAKQPNFALAPNDLITHTNSNYCVTKTYLLHYQLLYELPKPDTSFKFTPQI